MAAFRDVDRLFGVCSLRLFEGQSSGSLDYSSVAGREFADWLEDMNGRCTSEAAVD
jgi:hypothetical protein